MNLQTAPIYEIAKYIYQNWKNVSPYAEPYLRAMTNIDSINDNYFNDSASSVVLYFLSNAIGWRGDVAREVKAELRSRLGM